MWPVVLGKVIAGAALVAGGLFVWQKYQQEQERQHVYWEPFQSAAQPTEPVSSERSGLTPDCPHNLITD